MNLPPDPLQALALGALADAVNGSACSSAPQIEIFLQS
jgi:hypothetical protein